MDSSNIVPLAWQGYRGRALAGLAEKLPDLLPGLLDTANPQGQEVKGNLYRTVLRVPDLPHGLGTVYLKIYRFPRLINRLKFLFRRSPAGREWQVARQFRHLEIPTLEALAYGVKRTGFLPRSAFLLTREIPAAQPLDQSLEGKPPETRLALLRETARLVARMHRQGAHHGDLHQSNLLAREGDPPRIFLVDLYKAFPGGEVARRERIENLAHLCQGLIPVISAEEKREFLQSYQEFYRESDPDLPEDVEKERLFLTSRHDRSRDRRCVVNSSNYVASRGWFQHEYRRREFAPEVLEEALRLHNEAGEAETLKQDGRSRVTRIAIEGNPFCVKEIAPGGPASWLEDLLRGSRARRSWLAAHKFWRRGIACPKALGYREMRWLALPRKGLVVMEYLDRTTDVYHFLESGWPGLERQRRRELLLGCGQLVAGLHAGGLYHQDLQLRNVLVRRQGESWDLWIIDLESVKPGVPLTRKRKLKNLMQLNDTPAGVSRTDRLRFLRVYEKATGWKLTKQDLARVTRQTRRRQERAARIEGRTSAAPAG